ncbi:hypothetical protein ACFROC_32275, partial [Nocardia tengchongensis]|uniref:hypothetical protein n=1 Tax=Nocardia tengchongensis TaxID=2055889 RepID=UPI0036C48DD7
SLLHLERSLFLSRLQLASLRVIRQGVSGHRAEHLLVELCAQRQARGVGMTPRDRRSAGVPRNGVISG